LSAFPDPRLYDFWTHHKLPEQVRCLHQHPPPNHPPPTHAHAHTYTHLHTRTSTSTRPHTRTRLPTQFIRSSLDDELNARS
jgi:hypothetical protein